MKCTARLNLRLVSYKIILANVKTFASIRNKCNSAGARRKADPHGTHEPCYVSERTNVWPFLVPSSRFNSHRPSVYIAELRFYRSMERLFRCGRKGCARAPEKRYLNNVKGLLRFVKLALRITMSNHRRQFLHILYACLISAAWANLASAQSAADEANKSNNPLNLAASFNIQNYYTPSLFGAGSHINDALLRPAIPIGPDGLIGVPQIFRATAPVSARPDRNGGYNTVWATSIFSISFCSLRRALDR